MKDNNSEVSSIIHRLFEWPKGIAILAVLALAICAGCGGSGRTNTPAVPTFKLEYVFAQNVGADSVTIVPNDTVYTAGGISASKLGITVYTQLGKGQQSVFPFSADSGTFGPLAVSSANGNVYGPVSGGIGEFSPTGSFISYFNIPGGNEVFQGVVVDAKGDVYAVDGSNIQHFSASGTYLATISVSDAGLGPADDIAIDSGDNLYVGNVGTVTKLSTSGKMLEQFNCSSIAGADRSIALDGAGNIYTAASTENDIIRYSPAGAVTAVGPKNGFGIAVDSMGGVFAYDTTSISVYRASD